MKKQREDICCYSN